MILCIHRYIYIFLNTLSGGKSCSVAPGVAVPPWATETVLSPWLGADEARVSHVLSHVVWWKKNRLVLCNTMYFKIVIVWKALVWQLTSFAQKIFHKDDVINRWRFVRKVGHVFIQSICQGRSTRASFNRDKADRNSEFSSS